jgi:DNA polymerase III subunit epsilon
VPRHARPQPLAAITSRLPRAHSDELDSYLAILERVLEDRVISADEEAELASLAGELGLSAEAAGHAHRDYLGHVAAAAWSDKHVTDAERADLLEVANLLNVPDHEALAILEAERPAKDLTPTS